MTTLTMAEELQTSNNPGKFYVVVNGRQTGIYSSWDECEALVDGFPGAHFKKFGQLEEANQYFETTKAREDQRPSTPTNPNKRKKPSPPSTDSVLSTSEAFIPALLSVSVQQYRKSKDEGKESALWHQLCRKLQAPILSNRVEHFYENTDTHFAVRKSLLIEETRETIARALTLRSKTPCPLLQSYGGSQPGTVTTNRISFRLKVREPKERTQGKVDQYDTIFCTLHRPFPTNTSEKPNYFTPEEHQHLMAGTVFECKSVEQIHDNTPFLAVIIPCNPDRIKKEMQFDVRLPASALTYTAVGSEWHCDPLENLVSFERQFQFLCSEKKQELVVLKELMGTRLTANECSPEDSPTSPNSDGAEPESHDESLANIELPELNGAQSSAITSFLDAPSGSISIVQGPPGTGKTLLLVSAIVKCLQKANGKTRLLVCAPTNKAIMVLAQRFHEAVQDSSVRVMLVGDRVKLFGESSPTQNPLFPFYVYTWSDAIKAKLKEIETFCGKWNDNKARYIYGEMVKISQRIVTSLLGVPDDFKEKLENCCKIIRECSRVRCLPTECKVCVQDVLKQFSSFPEDHIRLEILNSAHVVFSTLCSSAGGVISKMKNVDVLVVDEAAAATEPEVYVPLLHLPKKLLAVGDPKQLPATVISDKAQNLGLSVSLLERLMFRRNYSYSLLNVQYRMNPKISLFPSSTFYDAKVKDGPNLPVSGSECSLLFPGKPYSFLNIIGKDMQAWTGSRYNKEEVEAVALLVDFLRNQNGIDWCNNTSNLRIITFYRSQVTSIRSKLEGMGLEKVDVGTVDAAQGSEASVVIVSFVRCGDSAGFIEDDRRLNVALTRAKHQLVCVGNMAALIGMKRAPTIHQLTTNAVSRSLVVEFGSNHNDARD